MRFRTYVPLILSMRHALCDLLLIEPTFYG
jgi:hypothetical protein